MGFFNGEPLESQGSFVSRLLIQLVIILVLPRILHWTVLQRVWQPRVVSEIISGIILGPSVMGIIPGFTDNIFPPRSMAYLNSLAQIGLILFLFMVGLGLDIEKIWQSRKVTIVSSTLGLGLPLCIAPAVALAFMHPEYTNANFQELILLIALLLMITALAVLARILADRKLFVSKLGSVTMSTTALDTFMGWVLLAIVLALYGSRVPWVPPAITCPGQVIITPNDANSSMDPIYIILCYLGLLLVVILPIRYFFTLVARRVERKGRMEVWVFWISIVICFSVAWVTQTLTLSGMFGAFTLGIFGVPRIGSLTADLRRALDYVVVIVLLPVFFCYSGLRTDWKLLDGNAIALAFLLLFSVYATKLIAVFFSAFVFGLRFFDALYYAWLLTCKGLTALAMLNICLDTGIITQKMFALCVFYSVLATIIPSPVIRFIQIFDHLCNKPKPAAPHDEYFRILVIPRAPYLSAAVMTVGTWLSNFSDTAIVTAGRIIDDLDEEFLEFHKLNPETQHHGGKIISSPSSPSLIDSSPSPLASDPILGICANRWHGLKKAGDLNLKAILAPNLVSDFTEFVTKGKVGETDDENPQPSDALVIGYDDTRETLSIIQHMSELESLKLVVCVCERGMDVVTATNILLLQGGYSPADDELAGFLSASALSGGRGKLFVSHFGQALNNDNGHVEVNLNYKQNKPDSGENVPLANNSIAVSNVNDITADYNLEDILHFTQKKNPLEQRIDLIICPMSCGQTITSILKNLHPSVPICFVKANEDTL